MTERVLDNNQALISGRVESGFFFSHTFYGEAFYILYLSVKRLSECSDLIPVMISERLIDVTQNYQGSYLEVTGQFRSHNLHMETGSHLILTVFAREVLFTGEEIDRVRSNQMFLDGYICKVPVYRRTPLGREIADVMLAVNRPYGKSDYIPCICWGKNARFASGFQVGDHVQIWGRIQSREYVKKVDETHSEKYTAYEVSVSRVENLA